MALKSRHLAWTILLALCVFGRTEAATVGLDADCSGADTCDTDFVCDTSFDPDACKVKADASATDCANDDNKCPASATCAGDGTCSCDAGYTNFGTGLCTAEDCSNPANTCGTDLVCDTSRTPDTCVVKADASATNCANDDNKCPASATCAGDGTCSCDAGYTNFGTGLCTAEDCSNPANTCGTDLVCDTSRTPDTCVVKADASATNCANDDNKCPASATCAGDGTCSCDAGYTDLGSGLCTANLGSDCSVVSCGDSTNHVCETVGASSTCKVKADATATSCASDDTKCPEHATCATAGTAINTCSCDTGYTNLGTGLCTAVIGMECSATSTCSSALTNSVCYMPTPCSKGQCACADGYSGADCLTLMHGTACSTGTCESTDLECSSTTTKCVCKSTKGTYYDLAGKCTTLALFGETCDADAKCNVLATANGKCRDTKCACKDNYIMATTTAGVQECRLPYASEEGCGVTGAKTPCQQNTAGGLILGTQQTPECSGITSTSTCECDATTEEKIMRSVNGQCVHYCLLTASTATLAAGADCTESTACNSKLCLQCPGTTKGSCYESPCSNFGVKMTANGIMLALFIALSAYLF